MLLPIDVSRRPLRQKYLEETPELRRWFIFGESPDGTTVDVADGERDVLTSVPRRMAEGIIAARDAFLDTVMDHLCGAAAAGKAGGQEMNAIPEFRPVKDGNTAWAIELGDRYFCRFSPAGILQRSCTLAGARLYLPSLHGRDELVRDLKRILRVKGPKFQDFAVVMVENNRLYVDLDWHLRRLSKALADNGLSAERQRHYTLAVADLKQLTREQKASE